MRTGGYTPPVLSVSSRHDLQSMLFYNVVCVIVSNASSLYFLRESHHSNRLANCDFDIPTGDVPTPQYLLVLRRETKKMQRKNTNGSVDNRGDVDRVIIVGRKCEAEASWDQSRGEIVSAARAH